MAAAAITATSSPCPAAPRRTNEAPAGSRRAGASGAADQPETLAVASAQERLKHARAGGVAELPQRLRFDLPDALAGHRELLAHLLQRVLGAVPDAEAH